MTCNNRNVEVLQQHSLYVACPATHITAGRWWSKVVNVCFRTSAAVTITANLVGSNSTAAASAFARSSSLQTAAGLEAEEALVALGAYGLFSALRFFPLKLLGVGTAAQPCLR